MRLGDLDALKNTKPEFMNEKVVRDTKYQTTRDRIYAKAWNACNSCWIETIDNAPTVEERSYEQGVIDGRGTEFDNGFEQGYAKGYENCEHDNERLQGEWKFSRGVTTQGSLKCPFCNYRDYHKTNSNFCPNCGAKMQKDVEENEKLHKL